MEEGLKWELVGSADAFHVSSILKTGAHRGRDTRIVMEKIVADMMRVEAITFKSQGRRGGGSWKKLKPNTIRKKGTHEILMTQGAKSNYTGLEPNALFKSLTEPNAPFQILTITRDSIRFGTDRPYAGAQQYGSWLRFIPPRPFLRFLPTDTHRWRQMIIDHLMEPFVRASRTKK